MSTSAYSTEYGRIQPLDPRIPIDMLHPVAPGAYKSIVLHNSPLHFEWKRLINNIYARSNETANEGHIGHPNLLRELLDLQDVPWLSEFVIRVDVPGEPKRLTDYEHHKDLENHVHCQLPILGEKQNTDWLNVVAIDFGVRHGLFPPGFQYCPQDRCVHLAAGDSLAKRLVSCIEEIARKSTVNGRPSALALVLQFVFIDLGKTLTHRMASVEAHEAPVRLTTSQVIC